jgi:hypothetical protein
MTTLTPEKRAEAEAQLHEIQAKDREKYEELQRHAQATYRAAEGWHLVEDREGWAKTSAEAREEYLTGAFLIKELGAERLLHPKMVATLLSLRRSLLADLKATTAADMMLVDLAVLGYYNALRVQGWIGNLSLWVEHELFGQSAPAVKLRRQHGPFEGLAVEESLKRLGEQLLPLLDRSNRMMVRNLKAIKELRQGQTPAVTVGQAQQVNVASQQVNAVAKG